ncbi:hypothetical protein [Lacibacter sediminis]|uniref:Uncharacterized protein n=1 Tax=Lacibacter sediminis TaxID=2760713 RepID=A0A7G5XEY5_9BACT|nr:hypothetical protein [Lacibacter sediminis]QNA44038.1 hypothetical protein H4075_18470 [Lacibacter sediminis]
MKTIIMVAALALSFSTSQANDCLVSSKPFIAKAKPVAAQGFGYFRIHRIANDVALNWSVTNPGSVTRFSVERSFDAGFSFAETLEEVECSSANPSYKYRDCTTFPGYLYYRVAAHYADGSTEYSPVEMIRIVSRRG